MNKSTELYKRDVCFPSFLVSFIMANAILPDFSKPVTVLQFALLVHGEFMF